MTTANVTPRPPTAEHVITVTDLGGDAEDKRRPVRVARSCGGLDAELPAWHAELSAQVHIKRVTRPTVDRAHEIAYAIRYGRVTDEHADQLALALIEAADIADRVNVVQSRNFALGALVKLVRGDA